MYDDNTTALATYIKVVCLDPVCETALQYMYCNDSATIGPEKVKQCTPTPPLLPLKPPSPPLSTPRHITFFNFNGGCLSIS